MAQIKLTVDHEAEAAYIRLSAAPVARTVEINDSILVDLDDMGVAVGIEILSLDADIPFTEITKQCHMHSDVIDSVRTIQPSISGFVRLSRGSDAATTQNDRRQHLADA